MKSLFLKPGYQERAHAEQTLDDPHSEFQPDVYALAELMTRFSDYNLTVIDIGCGSGAKLKNFGKHVSVIGLDSKENLALALRVRPNMLALPCDLETITRYSVPSSIVDGAILICADVLEHLTDPLPTLYAMREWMAWGARAAFISTPDRDAFYRPEHNGPPNNTSHVREWSFMEFRSLLLALSFKLTFYGLTRSHTSDPRPVTILGVLT